MLDKIVKFAKAYAYLGRHHSGEAATGYRKPGRHRPNPAETVYHTTGRATNRGNWGDEDTGLWPVVVP